jgi:hypothetical protein
VVGGTPHPLLGPNRARAAISPSHGDSVHSPMPGGTNQQDHRGVARREPVARGGATEHVRELCLRRAVRRSFE